MKSKLILFNEYGSYCWNNIVYSHQGLIQSEAIRGFNPCSRAVLTSVVNRVTMSSAMYLLGAKHIHSPALLKIGRRAYPYPLYLPMARAVRHLRRWFRKPDWVTFWFGSCIVFTVLFAKVERIPYSKRFHFVISERIERKIGEFQWNRLKKKHERKILPLTDPKTIRVLAISREIIQALHNGLRLERECSVNGYAPKSAIMSKDIRQGNLIASKYLGANGESKGNSSFEGEKVCLKVAQRSEKQAPKLIWKPATKHLDGMDWEVVVVDHFIHNAVYIAGGKILFYMPWWSSGRMSDAQIATTIGHEVGHAVSRHYAEHWIKVFWAICLLSILSNFFPINLGHGKIFHLVQLWRSRRMEKEADYIGLMLMASAGYDPREAPKSYEDNFSKDSIFSTHPCGSTRAKLLNRTEVMEEALAIYREVRAGCGVRSFI
ncbi:hypothetical protein L1049_019214 [Liquidambar formosana]|uniref:Peptidase M48 domain-containing protein n=1 Tax=Liquidambar formosana TaxID=63359 RepID=A0AAP0RC92_LIQFO